MIQQSNKLCRCEVMILCQSFSFSNNVFQQAPYGALIYMPPLVNSLGLLCCWLHLSPFLTFDICFITRIFAIIINLSFKTMKKMRFFVSIEFPIFVWFFSSQLLSCAGTGGICQTDKPKDIEG